MKMGFSTLDSKLDWWIYALRKGESQRKDGLLYARMEASGKYFEEYGSILQEKVL